MAQPFGDKAFSMPRVGGCDPAAANCAGARLIHQLEFYDDVGALSAADASRALLARYRRL
jgi:hypothetical protein